MAFNPGAVDYRTQILSQERGLSRLNEAKDRQRQRQAEIDRKKASKRSFGSKLASAALRGGAAYLTGGLSETMGGGQMIDRLALGEGAERNELGDMVGLGTSIYGGAKALAAKKLAGQDARFDKMYNRRAAQVKALDDINSPKADEARASLLNFERDYHENRNKMDTSGWDFVKGGLGQDDEGYQSMIPMMSKEEQTAQQDALKLGQQDKLAEDARVANVGLGKDRLKQVIQAGGTPEELREAQADIIRHRVKDSGIGNFSMVPEEASAPDMEAIEKSGRGDTTEFRTDTPLIREPVNKYKASGPSTKYKKPVAKTAEELAKSGGSSREWTTADPLVPVDIYKYATPGPSGGRSIPRSWLEKYGGDPELI